MTVICFGPVAITMNRSGARLVPDRSLGVEAPGAAADLGGLTPNLASVR